MKWTMYALLVLIGMSAGAQTVKPALPQVTYIEPQPIQAEPMLVLEFENYARSTPTEVAANALPEAPSPAASMVSSSNAPVQPSEREFKRFSASNTNRMLVATEFWARGLDALSTHQNLTNPCNCYHEASRFFGLDMTPVFKSSVGAYSYSLGIAATYSIVSATLWNASKNHPHHERLLRRLSRALLMGDSAMEIAADIHNLSIMDPGPAIK
jgi:hypothetical protein